jgi:hypothetical protein
MIIVAAHLVWVVEPSPGSCVEPLASILLRSLKLTKRSARAAVDQTAAGLFFLGTPQLAGGSLVLRARRAASQASKSRVS